MPSTPKIDHVPVKQKIKVLPKAPKVNHAESQEADSSDDEESQGFEISPVAPSLFDLLKSDPPAKLDSPRVDA